MTFQSCCVSVRTPVAMGKAAKVRELILSIAEDAWCSPPLLPDQGRGLWVCIWDEYGGALGSTFVPSTRCFELQQAAIDGACWWAWTSKGEAIYLPLSAARARFSGEVDPFDDTTALSTLESMRDTSSGDERRALEWAIAKISAGR